MTRFDSTNTSISIIPFRADLSPSFATLNHEWIARLFSVEASDLKVLGDPQRTIVDAGGQIFFAVEGGARPVGTVAAIRVADARYELAKMAVSPSHQGRGIGELLGRAVIEWAREAGARSIFLETNSSLANAIRLYERLGFVHAPFPSPSPYARSDVYMELRLPTEGVSPSSLVPGP